MSINPRKSDQNCSLGIFLRELGGRQAWIDGFYPARQPPGMTGVIGLPAGCPWPWARPGRDQLQRESTVCFWAE